MRMTTAKLKQLGGQTNIGQNRVNVRLRLVCKDDMMSNRSSNLLFKIMAIGQLHNFKLLKTNTLKSSSVIL